MKIFDINKSKIILGSNLNLDSFINESNYSNIILITDSNLHKIYQNIINKYPTIVIKSGEFSKDFNTVELIIKQLLKLGANRNTLLIGFGGGVITDITGFVASIYMRGVNFGFISTSLLSQVDASLGGKTGINFNNFKNMVGTFNQPEFVICDVNYLNTLDKEELINGMGEVIKHSLIADYSYFEYLENNIKSILNYDNEVLIEIISKSITIKSKIVSEDVQEKGIRKLLNFGHTFGHAIESIYKLKHGFAITKGMIIAMDLSIKLGFLDKIIIKRVGSLFSNFNLISSYSSELNILINLDKDEILSHILKDKKRINDNIDLIILDDIGNAFIHSISIDKLKKIL